MNPTLVHRYAFPLREAIEALLGDAVGDCEGWRIRVEGDEVIVDVVAPVPSIVPTIEEMVSGQKPGDQSRTKSESAPADAQAGETSPDAARQDPEPELKGGPLARRAAIACGERGFWTFLGVASADEAKADICRRCGITTRKMLDHDSQAAAIWQGIDSKYSLWKEGYDVELDDAEIM